MRYFFDTEFIDDGKTIDLISIGIVASDGREYYAESSEADLSRAGDWVVKNVFQHLRGMAKPRASIAREIVEFVGDSPEFWADYAAYDWVVLCQLFGTMMDLPESWPMFCRDLQQAKGTRQISTQDFGTAHDALADARGVAKAFSWLFGGRAYTYEGAAE